MCVLQRRLPAVIPRGVSCITNRISFCTWVCSRHLTLCAGAHHESPRRSSIAGLPYSPAHAQARGKTTKSSSKLQDVSQILSPLDPLSLKDEAPVLPTVLFQARNNMRKFENCILLTRVGGFYELYFEHADEFGPLLNLKVAQKKAGGRHISMAGFPFFQLDRYLKILVQDLNRYVAIAEEFPNDPSNKVKSGGLMHNRRVARVVTPGTLIDENFVDPSTNNYVLAIHIEEHDISARSELPISDSHRQDPSSPPIGLAWLDLSTGHFFTQITKLSALPSFLSRIGPKEIVLDEALRKLKDHAIFLVLEEDHRLVSYVSLQAARPVSEWSDKLESPIPVSDLNSFTSEEIAAGSALLQYVDTRLQGSDMKIQPPIRQFNIMGIDKNTMRALEVKKTLRDNRDLGSLLHTIRRTVTKGGARLLESWLSSPSTCLETINSRLDLVAYMLKDEMLRERLAGLLKRSHDSHRLLQKFAFGRGQPDDLLALASTVYATQELVQTLLQVNSVDDCVQALVARVQLDGPSSLAFHIREAIDEDGISQQQEIENLQAGAIQALAEEVISSDGSKGDSKMLKGGGKFSKKPASIRDYYSDDNQAWIMKPAASATLERLHQDLLGLNTEKQSLATALCSSLSVTSLTLRFTPGLGHICHIKGKDVKRDLPDMKNITSSKSTRSFHHPQWTNLGQRIDQCKSHIRSEEQRVFNSLREQVITHIIKLRHNAAVLDELDVACSFATLAAEKEWIRPILNQGRSHRIIGGRHPTVEGGLIQEGRTFISNDCTVGDMQRTWLITGPNMAGKSTFLRQNALITILAQAGSYVPAEYCELGIVDQIFTRVGSADSLHQDQSTFMVEMLETAAILNNATPRSFVIMDEIGRGTTPEDGNAVAFACLHHLYHVNKSRTLFATHFHSLADMVVKEGMEGVGFYCTDVEESGLGDGFRYVHKLRQGVNRQSHALKVARLAGLPKEAIETARKMLNTGLEKSV